MASDVNAAAFSNHKPNKDFSNHKPNKDFSAFNLPTPHSFSIDSVLFRFLSICLSRENKKHESFTPFSIQFEQSMENGRRRRDGEESQLQQQRPSRQPQRSGDLWGRHRLSAAITRLDKEIESLLVKKKIKNKKL